MKLGPNQTAWVRALQSGAFTQAQGALRTSDGMCCMGVACELYNPRAWETQKEGVVYFMGDYQVPPEAVVDFYGLRNDTGSLKINGKNEDLTALNDEGKSFEEIADLIEAHADELFSEPK